jgi:hypothetical protein
MAAPQVSGALALLMAKYPAENYLEIIQRLFNATDPLPALAGKCVTGGRLNLRKALSPPILLSAKTSGTNASIQLHVSAGPNRDCVVLVSTNLSVWSPLYTNTTSAAGTFDFTDDASTNATQRFYRVSSTL